MNYAFGRGSLFIFLRCYQNCALGSLALVTSTSASIGIVLVLALVLVLVPALPLAHWKEVNYYLGKVGDPWSARWIKQHESWVAHLHRRPEVPAAGAFSAAGSHHRSLLERRTEQFFVGSSSVLGTRNGAGRPIQLVSSGSLSGASCREEGQNRVDCHVLIYIHSFSGSLLSLSLATLLLFVDMITLAEQFDSHVCQCVKASLSISTS
jgi:hypothetical protein